MAVSQMKPIKKTDYVMNILHIDDNSDLLEEIRENLQESENYVVVSVANPLDAVKILSEKKEFQLVIVDIFFDKRNSISGDDFIKKSKSFLKNAKILAFTGFENRIKSENKELFDGIFLKGTEDDKLYEHIDNFFRILSKNVKVKKENEIDKKEFSKYHTLSPDIIENHERTLLQELEKVDGNDVVIISGNVKYTANDLIQEIRNKTEIGKYHIEMLFSYLDSKKGTY